MSATCLDELLKLRDEGLLVPFSYLDSLIAMIREE